MDINPENEDFYTTQCQEAFLNYVENKYYPKQRCLLIINPITIPSNNLFFTTVARSSGQESYDAYDLSSRDKAEI